MNKYAMLLCGNFYFFILFIPAYAQNVGIGTTNPQASLDVMNSLRVGGVNKFLSYDSVSGRFNLINSKLGINNPNPQFPLTFNSQVGEKISLWTDGGPTHYGLGIDAGLLQIFTNMSVDDVAFGYGSSTAFTENVRIKGNGNVGIGNNPQFKLDVSNRMRLRSGGDLGNSAGIWMNKTNNSNIQTFFGVENDTYAGIFGSGSFWSFGVNTNNGDVKIMGRLGIGTTTPNAPLTFPTDLGKKITLFSGGSGDAGFAVQGNLVQIFADNPNADIAFGYDQGGTFTERFRIKGNGALVVNGVSGNPGQVLQSNGNGVPTWIEPKTPSFYQYTQTGSDIPITTTGGFPPGTYDIGGLHNQSITVTRQSNIIISYRVPLTNPNNIGGGNGAVIIEVRLNNSSGVSVGGISSRESLGNGTFVNVSSTFFVMNVPPGTYTTHLKVQRAPGSGADDLATGSNHFGGCCQGHLSLEVVPL